MNIIHDQFKDQIEKVWKELNTEKGAEEALNSLVDNMTPGTTGIDSNTYPDKFVAVHEFINENLHHMTATNDEGAIQLACQYTLCMRHMTRMEFIGCAPVFRVDPVVSQNQLIEVHPVIEVYGEVDGTEIGLFRVKTTNEMTAQFIPFAGMTALLRNEDPNWKEVNKVQKLLNKKKIKAPEANTKITLPSKEAVEVSRAQRAKAKSKS